MLDTIIDAYSEAIFDTDSERALEVIHRAVAGGVSPEEVVFKVVIPSIDQFLKELGTRNASLAQHYLTSQVAADVVEEMIPLFQQKPEILGRIVIGTSPGDYHGLGKRIVTGCLKAQMVAVTDLGLSVAPERFVDAALENDAQVIAISSMMVHTARGENGCRKVRSILQERGLENRIKIIVGGAPYRFDAQLYLQVGADATADNAMVAVPVITGLIREVLP